MAQADPDLALRLAKATADLYGQAVQHLLTIVARRLAQGITEEGWAERKLLEFAGLRQDILTTITGLQADSRAAITSAVLDGYDHGARQGVDDLRQIGVRTTLTRTNTRTVRALINETISAVHSTHLRILRSTTDTYRSAVAEAVGQTVAGADTRRQAAQRVLDRLANSGITGFVDDAGRSWELASYAEMATRTGTGRAQVAGALDRYEAAGRDLVIVSDSPQECSSCRPWEGRVLSVSGKDRRYPSVGRATSAGLLHANCFPAEVVVSGPGVRAADARWYEGDLVVIHTASGDQLPVTPNHPVLTAEGWVPAGSLHVGDQLIRHLHPERVGLVGPDDEGVPAPIGEVAGALRQAGPVVAMSVPSSAEQFHGDGLGGDVDVVLADSLLRDRGDLALRHPCGHTSLVVGGVGLGALLAESATAEVVFGASQATDSLVSGGDLSGSLLDGHAFPLAALGFPSADLDPALDDPTGDAGLADAEDGRQLALRLSGSVALDQVVDLGRRKTACHVYNLQTAEGWYTANGIVVHNCRHSLGLYVPGLTRRMTRTADPEGDAARQEQRRLERGVRQWRRREAVALTPEAGRLAKAKADEWSRRLGEHVRANDLKRQRQRETLGAR